MEYSIKCTTGVVLITRPSACSYQPLPLGQHSGCTALPVVFQMQETGPCLRPLHLLLSSLWVRFPHQASHFLRLKLNSFITVSALTFYFALWHILYMYLFIFPHPSNKLQASLGRLWVLFIGFFFFPRIQIVVK